MPEQVVDGVKKFVTARDRVDSNFADHPIKGDQEERRSYIRAGARALAVRILGLTLESREQSIAITKLEEVVMWAHEAIARNE